MTKCRKNTNMCAQKNGKDLPLALTLAILQMHCILQMTRLALTLALTRALTRALTFVLTFVGKE